MEKLDKIREFSKELKLGYLMINGERRFIAI